MKKFFLPAIVLIGFFLLNACSFPGKRVKGNGNIETENRQVSRANKIKVMGMMDVSVAPGETSVRVEADENLLPYIITELDDNWLEIKIANNMNIKTDNPIKVYVTTPSLYSITMAGSGNISATGDFDSGEKATFKIGGSGDITMGVIAPQVDANIAGSGNLILSGETRDVEITVAGSGNFNGVDLKAENANVKIAGSGDVLLFADVSLNAKIMGSGNIKYKGNPTVERKIMGSGNISKLP